MKCKAVISEIEEREAAAVLSAEAEAHLPSCESCRAFAHERASLRLLVGSLGKVPAPPDFDWRLRARLAEAGKERDGARRFLAGFAPGAQAIAGAACVTLLLVAVVVYRQWKPAHHSLTQSAEIAGVSTKERAGAGSENKTPPPANASGSPAAGASNGRPASLSNETTGARSLKSGRANTARTEAPREPAPQGRIYSNDMASRAAQDLTSGKAENTSKGVAPVFSVGVPSETPAQLRFEDGQGTRRTLSPVNFGGQQQLTGQRDKARLIPASEKGIW